MRRYMSVLCAAVLCVCCLALAACGGNAPASSGASSAASGTAASESTAQEPSSVAADPAEKFVGDWKLAGAEMEGITITGDFAESGIFGTEMNVTMSIAQDGTGAMAFNDESTGLTWELKDDDTITVTPDNESETITTVDVVYDDGVLTMLMDDDEFSGTIMLSADGKLEGMREISGANAVDITSQDDLVGTWRLSGMNMMGMTMYGSADALAAMMGESDSATLVFDADGTASLMGDDATWELGSEGASINTSGTSIPVKSLDGDLVIDMGSMLGTGMELVMVFSK